MPRSGDADAVPGSGRSPGGGQPPPASLPGESHGQRSRPHRVAQTRAGLKLLSSTHSGSQLPKAWSAEWWSDLSYLQKGSTRPHPILAILSHLNYEGKKNREILAKLTAHGISSLEDWDLIIGLETHPLPLDLKATSPKGYLEQFLLPSTSCWLSNKKKNYFIYPTTENTIWKERASIRTRHGRDVGIIRAGI